MRSSRFFTTLVTLVFAIIVSSCGNQGTKTEPQAEPQVVAEDLHLHYIQVSVEGMTCEGCQNTVKGAIEKVEGVQMASATHVDKYALAGYDAVTPDTAALRAAITTAGYTVTGFKFIGHDLPKKE
jgi:copper chaperone CopZ